MGSNASTRTFVLAILIASSPAILLTQSDVSFQGKAPWKIAPAEAYIGAQQCGACHPAKLALQQTSEHARALSAPGGHSLAGQFAPSQTFVRGDKFSFRFTQDSGVLRLRAWSETQEITVPIEWAFGAGSQAVTFASRVDSQWYIEHALTYYSSGRSYATTPGQSILPEVTLPAALGKLFRSDDASAGVLHCFQCHSTGPVARDEKGELHPHELGVRCEVCHGPGRAHRDAARSGNAVRARQLIQNPRRMSADQMNYFCGNCHRPPAAAGTEIDWSVAWNVRHQPAYLGQAECFRKSQGALTCLTCHDPHAPLQTDTASYNAKCASCHDQNLRPPAPACLAAKPSNCVDCHMPRVSPQPYLRFTNHWIGIYETLDKLKPSIAKKPLRP